MSPRFVISPPYLPQNVSPRLYSTHSTRPIQPPSPLSMAQRVPQLYRSILEKLVRFEDPRWKMKDARPVLFRDLVRENFQSKDVAPKAQRSELRFAGIDLNPNGYSHVEVGSLYPIPTPDKPNTGVQRLYTRLQHTRSSLRELFTRLHASHPLLKHHVSFYGELSIIVPQPNGAIEKQLSFIDEFLPLYDYAKSNGITLMPALLGNACPDYCLGNVKRDFDTDLDCIHRAITRLRQFDPQMKIIVYVSGAFGVFADKKAEYGPQFYVDQTQKIITTTMPSIVSLGDTFGLGTHQDIDLMMRTLNTSPTTPQICLHSHGYDAQSIEENIERLAQNNATFLARGGNMFDGNSIPLSSKNFVVSESCSEHGWSGNMPLSLLLCQSVLQGFSVNGRSTLEEKTELMTRVVHYLNYHGATDPVFSAITPELLKAAIPTTHRFSP